MATSISETALREAKQIWNDQALSVEFCNEDEIDNSDLLTKLQKNALKVEHRRMMHTRACNDK